MYLLTNEFIWSTMKWAYWWIEPRAELMKCSALQSNGDVFIYYHQDHFHIISNWIKLLTCLFWREYWERNPAPTNILIQFHIQWFTKISIYTQQIIKLWNVIAHIFSAYLLQSTDCDKPTKRKGCRWRWKRKKMMKMENRVYKYTYCHSRP